MKKKLLLLSKILKTLKVVKFANLQFVLLKEPKPQFFGHHNDRNLDKTGNLSFLKKKLGGTIKKNPSHAGPN
jgi:hypothetical protein